MQHPRSFSKRWNRSRQYPRSHKEYLLPCLPLSVHRPRETAIRPQTTQTPRASLMCRREQGCECKLVLAQVSMNEDPIGMTQSRASTRLVADGHTGTGVIGQDCLMTRCPSRHLPGDRSLRLPVKFSAAAYSCSTSASKSSVMDQSAASQLAREKPSTHSHLPVSRSHTPLLLQN